MRDSCVIRYGQGRGIFNVGMGLSFKNILIHLPPPKFPESIQSAGHDRD